MPLGVSMSHDQIFFLAKWFGFSFVRCGARCEVPRTKYITPARPVEGTQPSALKSEFIALLLFLIHTVVYYRVRLSNNTRWIGRSSFHMGKTRNETTGGEGVSLGSRADLSRLNGGRKGGSRAESGVICARIHTVQYVGNASME